MDKTLTHWFIVIILFLSVLPSTLVLAEPDTNGVMLVLDRSDRRLYVKKQGHTLRSFKVALGSGQHSKQRSGDKATPTGTYHIHAVRDSARFYKFIELDYPNKADAKRGLLQGLITRSQYQQIINAHNRGQLPPQYTALGGSIGIHGIGRETDKKIKIHQLFDWTKGCIAIRNSEIEQLTDYIIIGMPIMIVD